MLQDRDYAATLFRIHGKTGLSRKGCGFLKWKLKTPREELGNIFHLTHRVSAVRRSGPKRARGKIQKICRERTIFLPDVKRSAGILGLELDRLKEDY